jgi:FkbM family methyltransferase
MSLIILRIRKLLAAIGTPLYARALRHGVAATIEHSAALARFDFDFVVDVGANKGQFAAFIRTRFPKVCVVSFEPLAQPAAILESVFEGDALLRVVNAAIGVRRGRQVMNVTEHDDSSSLLDVGKAQQAEFGTKVIERREIICGPLSDFIAPEEFGARNLLKIDTQGYELEVLKGSEDLLERFSVIYCELSYIELYKGQPLASEVISYLLEKGFRLAGVFNQNVSTNLGALQADMLFVKAAECDKNQGGHGSA